MHLLWIATILLFTKSFYGELIDLSVVFNPVDTPTEKETAEVAKIWSDVDSNYISAGVMSADEVRDIRRSEEGSAYSTLADDIEGDIDEELDKTTNEALDEWEESKHPRDEKGRFTSSGNFSKAEPDNKGSAKVIERKPQGQENNKWEKITKDDISPSEWNAINNYMFFKIRGNEKAIGKKYVCNSLYFKYIIEVESLYEFNPIKRKAIS